MGRKTQTLEVKNISVSLITIHNEDYICITDIAKAKEGDSRAADIIKNWIRNRSTLEFLGAPSITPDLSACNAQARRQKNLGNI